MNGRLFIRAVFVGERPYSIVRWLLIGGERPYPHSHSFDEETAAQILEQSPVMILCYNSIMTTLQGIRKQR